MGVYNNSKGNILTEKRCVMLPAHEARTIHPLTDTRTFALELELYQNELKTKPRHASPQTNHPHYSRERGKMECLGHAKILPPCAFGLHRGSCPGQLCIFGPRMGEKGPMSSGGQLPFGGGGFEHNLYHSPITPPPHSPHSHKSNSLPNAEGAAGHCSTSSGGQSPAPSPHTGRPQGFYSEWEVVRKHVDGGGWDCRWMG